MSVIDLQKIEAAMNWLADTPQGSQAVAALAQACDTLQLQIPQQLNTAEMRYVLERLMSQRDINDPTTALQFQQGGSQASAYSSQGGSAGYQSQQGYGAFAPQQVSAISPSSQLRVLPRGFRVRALA